MKRPQGFERPATPAVPSTPAAPQHNAAAPKNVQKKQGKPAASPRAPQPAPAQVLPASTPAPPRMPTGRPSPPKPSGAPQPAERTAPRVEPKPPAKPYTRAPRTKAPALPTAWWMTKAADTEATEAVSAAAVAQQHPDQKVSSRSSSTADAITEPITVQTGAPAPVREPSRPSLTSTQDLASSGPLAPVTQLNTAVQQASVPPSSARAGNEHSPGVEENLGAAGEGSELPLKPASARAKLRAATKARRSYERAEVRRFTRHLRRRRAVWLASIGAALALALFVAVGTFSPLMALTTVQVEGAQRLDPVEVAGSLSGQLGTPLPLVDMGEVKTGLSQFSLIQSFATESRPPHTLVVRIVERDPIGAIAGANGFDLVDPAGVVIQTTPERPEGFPIAEVAGSEGLAAAGSVVQALPADIRAQLDFVRAASTDDVNLTLLGGATVAWGSAEQSAQKAVVLSKLMAAAPPGTVSVYDVSSPASPVVR